MRTRDRVVARFFKSSDRTHISAIRWTKKERAEWCAQSREQAASVIASLTANDLVNAISILIALERLEAVGISTLEHHNARRETFDRLREISNV